MQNTVNDFITATFPFCAPNYFPEGTMKPLTIFAGHYGSGKTNIAVNYALRLRMHDEPVILCDLDIVNPYFRTADAADRLRDAGVTLVASAFANSNLEAPSLPPDVSAVFDTPGVYGVIDVGGDDQGMLALGRYANRVRQTAHDLLLVANCYRPLARAPRDALALMREMEQTAGLPFTGLVNNPNIGAATTENDVLAAKPYIEELSALTGLPVVMTCIDVRLRPPNHSGATRHPSTEGNDILWLDLIENRFGVT